MSNPGDCAHIVESTVADLGRLDVLVKLASVSLATPFDELRLEDWDTLRSSPRTAADIV